ncbi:MAG TPA: hypothetical protein VF203_02305, partial [Burkholderiales bacterium]
HGIRSYRGTEASWIHRGEPARTTTRSKRLCRLTDAYLPVTGSNVTPWSGLAEPGGLVNVPASRFLRPYSPRLRRLEALRLRRIERAMRTAARAGEIFHMWWHPHNFGTYQDENLAFLQQVLEIYVDCRREYGMCSLSMAEVAERTRALAAREAAETSRGYRAAQPGAQGP